MTNSDIIIRNFKLHILSGIELKEPFSSIYKELKETFSDLNVYKSELLGSIYYGKTKHTRDIYIRYGPEVNIIWIHYDNVWLIFRKKHYLSDDNIHILIKWYLNYAFKIKGKTSIMMTQQIFPLGKAYKKIEKA